MAHSFTSLLVHAIFSTKNRAPDLSPEIAGRLFPYMGGIVTERQGVPLIINGPADHVHLLVSLPTEGVGRGVAESRQSQFVAMGARTVSGPKGIRLAGWIRCVHGEWLPSG